MTGLLDVAEEADRPHRCDRPPIWEAVYLTDPHPDGYLRTWRRVLPDGTRFHCDLCPLVWVVGRAPSDDDWPTSSRAGTAWLPETRRQRRKRLGLRWWQR